MRSWVIYITAVYRYSYRFDGRYAPNYIEPRRLYADNKLAFDSLIEQLLADLAQTDRS